MIIKRYLFILNQLVRQAARIKQKSSGIKRVAITF